MSTPLRELLAKLFARARRAEEAMAAAIDAANGGQDVGETSVA